MQYFIAEFQLKIKQSSVLCYLSYMSAFSSSTVLDNGWRNSQFKENQPIDIIQETRRLVRGKDQNDRFHIAKIHLQNALNMRAPRLDTFSNQKSKMFKFCYSIQSSSLWRILLLTLSYIVMYLIVLEEKADSKFASLVFSIIITFLFWIDLFMEVYHKTHETLMLVSKFQTRFFVKLVILILISTDFILVLVNEKLQIRPLLIARCFLPLFYDANIRKTVEALLKTYKDIFVLLLFYMIIIVGFAIVACQIIQLPEDADIDPYSNNYKELHKTIFIMYILSTYDSYPDNQLVAIKKAPWIYAFFIIYIFLNIFFFATIPPTLVFNSFRETRSKIVLIDEIKQQHSLIMSFVSLGQQNLNISQEKLIQFLLFLYKNKMRYVDYITQICRKLDKNNNGIIHIKQYMNLCKILSQKSSMLPPKFNDLVKWVQLRRYLNQKLNIKLVVTSNKFKVTLSLFILVCFINSLLSLYTKLEIFDILDNIIAYIFVAEVLIKVFGLGVEKYFTDPWNKVDFISISLGLALEIIPQEMLPHNSDVLIKMTRIFRVTTFIKFVSHKKKLHSTIYLKVTKLVSQIVIIIPIVLKFLPVYMLTLYFLGTTSMQIFRQSIVVNHGKSPYAAYEQYSNFLSFVGSQFFFIQILVESQWSTLVFNEVFKFNSYTLIMIFFVLSHALLVTILTSLLKGIAWQVYSTVFEELNDRNNKLIKDKLKQEQLHRKKQKVEQIKARIDQKQELIPDNLLTKELYENKIDDMLFKSVKQMSEKQKPRKRKRSDMINYLIKQYNIISDEVDKFDPKTSMHELVFSKQSQFLDLIDIEGQDDLEENIEQEMERVLRKISVHNGINYSETIIYPKIFIQFLETKFKPLKTLFMEQFDSGEDEYESFENYDIFTDGLNELLGIHMTEREQKALILKNMVQQQLISDEHAKALIKKSGQKNYSIDSDWIMRKAFLSDTNQKLIKKFQIEYFSNIYGKSFKEINKPTIEPLIRLQSKLLYCLRNCLRYRKTSTQKFFKILSTIQNTITNQLLKKGSLFKFVYQIDSISDLWFSLELRQSKELKVHFIKNGIWIYHRTMKQNTIMIAEDIFNCCSMMQQKQELQSDCQGYVKMMFESFQSLAFCLKNEENFFNSDPSCYIYDLFSYFFSVDGEKVERVKTRNISISKIMVILLSKEDERTEQLPYKLSEIKNSQVDLSQNNIPKSYDFKIDQSQNQTFSKLKQMQLMDHERIVEDEGLPFTYMTNLMIEIVEIMRLYNKNFVYQVENFINSRVQQNQ